MKNYNGMKKQKVDSDKLDILCKTKDELEKLKIANEKRDFSLKIEALMFILNSDLKSSDEFEKLNKKIKELKKLNQEIQELLKEASPEKFKEYWTKKIFTKANELLVAKKKF